MSKPEQIRCYFLDEASGMEEKWTVTLATREAVDQLVSFFNLLNIFSVNEISWSVS